MADYETEVGPFRHLIRAVGIILIIAVVILIAGTLAHVGTPQSTLMFGSLFAFVAVCLTISIRYGTMRLGAFYTSGQSTPFRSAGLAGFGATLAAPAYLVICEGMFQQGFDYLAIAWGLVFGLFLAGIFIVPHMRRFGGVTLAEFIEARFDPGTRSVFQVLALMLMIPLLIALITSAAQLIALSVALPDGMAELLFGIMLVICCVFGGLRSMHAVGMFLALMAMVMLLLPWIWLSQGWANELGSIFQPFEAMSRLALLETALNIKNPSSPGHLLVDPGTQSLQSEFFAIVALTGFGTAALPFLLMRFSTVIEPAAAPRAVGRAMVLGSVAIILSAGLAVSAKLALFSTIFGHPIADGRALNWMFPLENGLAEPIVAICGDVARDLASVTLACGGPDHILFEPDIAFENTPVFLIAPLASGLPTSLAIFLVLGAVAAILAIAGPVLLTISNSLAHDFLYRGWDRQAPSSRRLIVSRIAVIGTAAAAVWGSWEFPLPLEETAGAIINLSAASLFALFIVSIWWRNVSAGAAGWGMLMGFASTLLYMVVLELYGLQPPIIPGTDGLRLPVHLSGLVGLAVNVVIIFVGTLVFSRPSQKKLDFVDELRRQHPNPMYADRA